MNLGTWLLDLIFPPKCPFCEQILEHPRDPLCSKCQPLLPWLEKREAFRKVDFTSGCYSPLEYRDAVRTCIHRYKFTPIRARGEPLGKLMAQCVADHPDIKPDVVTWAPLSAKRRRERGFDQGEELARALSRELGLKVEGLLVKTRHNGRQSDLKEHAQRKANVLGAYTLRPGGAVRGRRVLLVDDVVTSGATLSACAKVLVQAGAEEVWCVTLAQAGK